MASDVGLTGDTSVCLTGPVHAVNLVFRRKDPETLWLVEMYAEQ